MSRKKTIAKKKRGLGLFSVAAAVFTIGVVSLSVMQYKDQRDITIEQVDRSLLDSAYAAKCILDIDVPGLVQTPSEFSSNAKRLEQFARTCNLTTVAAATLLDDGTWSLLAGTDHNNLLSPGPVQRGDILDSTSSPIVDLLVQGRQHVEYTAFAPNGSHGTLRVAVIHARSPQNHGYTIAVVRDMEHVNADLYFLAFRYLGKVAFLHLIAFPLVASYNLMRIKTTKRMAELDDQLKQDYEKLKTRETELQDAVRDLKRFNTVTLGREGRIIELKAEVNSLLKQQGQKKRYNVDRAG